MAKKFKRKDSEYDVYQFKLDDNTRPDWFNEAVAAGKITLHADHAVLETPGNGSSPIRMDPGWWVIMEDPDYINTSDDKIFKRVFEEKP